MARGINTQWYSTKGFGVCLFCDLYCIYLINIRINLYINIIFLSYRQIVFAKNVRQYRYTLQACGVSNHFKSKSIMYSKDCILSTVNISIFQFRAWCSHLHRWFVQVEFVFLFQLIFVFIMIGSVPIPLFYVLGFGSGATSFGSTASTARRWSRKAI